jgi:hypothetical protein
MRIGALSALQAALMLLLPAQARAEANSCDLLKAKLGSRIEAGGVHGYSLEAVPSKTPTPSGAKVIGTCEGGAMKMLYRRFGGSSAAVSPATEAAPSPAPAPAPVKESAAKAPAPQKPVPEARTPAPAPVAAPSPPPPPAPVIAAAPAPTPAPAVAPLAKPLVAASMPTPAPAIATVATTASMEPAASQPAANTMVAASSPIAAASDVVMAASAAPSAQPADTKPADAGPLISQRASEFFTEHWRWIAALALLPLLALLWVWRTHHSAYDEAGLPRGPKLKI